jgi:hypothetical protein
LQFFNGEETLGTNPWTQKAQRQKSFEDKSERPTQNKSARETTLGTRHGVA